MGGKSRAYQLRGTSDESKFQVAGGLLYIGSCDSSVYAIDAATGETAWRKILGGEVAEIVTRSRVDIIADAVPRWRPY